VFFRVETRLASSLRALAKVNEDSQEIKEIPHLSEHRAEYFRAK